MSNITVVDTGAPTRTVSCDMAFAVSVPSELVLQVVASESAGRVEDEFFEILMNGAPVSSVTEVRDLAGARMHIVHCDPGRLTVAYRARIDAGHLGRTGLATAGDSGTVGDAGTVSAGGTVSGGGTAGGTVGGSTAPYERQVYLRPSRYCPSDHLVGFAAAEFGTGPHVVARVAAITRFIRQRIGYVPGSSSVHDSAEDTLLTGMGTCRDFAHLGVALCRATGVPARFVAVYAPGLYPMDFHAVFEAFENGRWYVYDSTGLAPRQSLVRIVTGRDAADAAFAATISGNAELETIEVSATVGGRLPTDDYSRIVELA
jgi:hypothetical protein